MFNEIQYSRATSDISDFFRSFLNEGYRVKQNVDKETRDDGEEVSR